MKRRDVVNMLVLAIKSVMGSSEPDSDPTTPTNTHDSSVRNYLSDVFSKCNDGDEYSVDVDDDEYSVDDESDVDVTYIVADETVIDVDRRDDDNCNKESKPDDNCSKESKPDDNCNKESKSDGEKKDDGDDKETKEEHQNNANEDAISHGSKTRLSHRDSPLPFRDYHSTA